MAIRRHWIARRNAGEVTTDYANKQMRYVRQMIAAYYDDLDVPPAQRTKPFDGLPLAKMADNEKDEEKKRPALPMSWITGTLLNDERMDGLNDEALAIARIVAETGARQGEIYNLPEADIHLDDPIPHIMIRAKTEGPERRQIKNGASKRPIVLLGTALVSSRRHPAGFPRYRGNGNFTNAVASFLKDRKLFPATPPGGSPCSLGGLRHTYEDRMKAAGLANEERALLMGHSVKVLRGRPIYGAELDLHLRALYQEMVSLPADDWRPRPIAELRGLVDARLEELGFRTR
jgi:integrase